MTTTAVELDTLSERWQLALDATDHALTAEGRTLPADELGHRRKALVDERRHVAEDLASLARMTGVRPLPWLSPVPMSNDFLGLPSAVTTCLFDLDGVLTDSGVLHASAWAQVLDDFLLQLSEEAGWHFIPFDRHREYRGYLDGRPRLEGLEAFLASRGISVSEESALGLAARKDDVLKRELYRRGSTALPGSRRYLEAAGHAGLARGVLSASANTTELLDLAGLSTLVEARVDAAVMRRENLSSRPAPDVVLAGCRRLDAEPKAAVIFTHSAAGAAAAHAAGVAVIGIGKGTGADREVGSLVELLDRRLL
ncbi:MAG TPA: HAD family hydrolase [Gaiellaceae bacterium]|nr:HAD family hydrolase [Gaiellaceae bacterium]